MAIPIVPYGMGYTEWSKRVHRPTNLEWIRRNSMRKAAIRRIFGIFDEDRIVYRRRKVL
jgi:hypothetical protein